VAELDARSDPGNGRGVRPHNIQTKMEGTYAGYRSQDRIDRLDRRRLVRPALAERRNSGRSDSTQALNN
jgi:hypothetical protein